MSPKKNKDDRSSWSSYYSKLETTATGYGSDSSSCPVTPEMTEGLNDFQLR